MELTAWARRFAKKAAAAITKPKAPLSELDRMPGVRSLDAQEELQRRAEINARGAAIRAERARAVDFLLYGRSRWIARRAGWLR